MPPEVLWEERPHPGNFIFLNLSKLIKEILYLIRNEGSIFFPLHLGWRLPFWLQIKQEIAYGLFEQTGCLYTLDKHHQSLPHMDYGENYRSSISF